MLLTYADIVSEEEMKAEKNRGFTLIEVIVSMLILTIVAVPLIRTFYTSASSNRRTAKNQNASLAAQSVMETAKGYDIGAFSSALRNAVEAGGADATGITISGGYVTKDDSGVTLPEEQRSDKCIYNVAGFRIGPDTYDLKVTYDATGDFYNPVSPTPDPLSPTPLPGAPVPSPTPQFNNFMIPDIYNMDSNNCVLIAENGYEYGMCDNNALAIFKSRYDYACDEYAYEHEYKEFLVSLNEEGIAPYVQRTIEITVDTGESEGDVRISAILRYSVHGFLEPYIEGDDPSYSLLSREIGGDGFERIYLFYSFFKRPLSDYDDVISMHVTDAFRAKYSAKDVGVYVVQQDMVSGVEKGKAEFVINGCSFANATITPFMRETYGFTNLHFFSQTNMSNSYDLIETEIFHSTENINRIYRVTVDVYEHGVDFTDADDMNRKRLSTMDSVITR